MELTSKAVLEIRSEKSSPVPNIGSNNRIREYFYKNNQQNAVSNCSTNGIRTYSMNKTLASQHNAKIDLIKIRCFQTSKIYKVISKELVKGKNFDDD